MEPDDADDRVEFDVDTGVHRTSFGQEEGDLCFALVDAIATIEQTDPIEVMPLGDSINMDALEQIVQSSRNTCTLELTLPDHSYHVVIQSEGVIELQPTDSDRRFTKN